jgi:hypothetical protein
MMHFSREEMARLGQAHAEKEEWRRKHVHQPGEPWTPEQRYYSLTQRMVESQGGADQASEPSDAEYQTYLEDLQRRRAERQRREALKRDADRISEPREQAGVCAIQGQVRGK